MHGVSEFHFDQRRIVVCLGPGGVGKTSVVAALALRAARAGKRVLAITVDPARRLAQALHLTEIRSDPTRVDPRAFGVDPFLGQLEVRMLDAGQMLEDLVIRYAETPATRDALLNNRAFGFLARNMAGVQPYMAMEAILALERRAEYDVIFVDTPPSERALEFLDAPERMQRLLESPITRALANMGRMTQESRGGVLGRGARLFLKGVSQVTGSGLVDELSLLLGALSDLLGGFFERATLAEERFRSEALGVLLVTAAGAIEAAEAKRMLGLLQRRSLNLDGVILNRMFSGPADGFNAEGLSRWLDPKAESPSARPRIEALLAESRAEALVHMQSRQSLQRSLPDGAAVYVLPRIAGEVKSSADLLSLERALVAAGAKHAEKA
jgi:anion-transporting  ArsA/GET3 family ATPase